MVKLFLPRSLMEMAQELSLFFLLIQDEEEIKIIINDAIDIFFRVEEEKEKFRTDIPHTFMIPIDGYDINLEVFLGFNNLDETYSKKKYAAGIDYTKIHEVHVFIS